MQITIDPYDLKSVKNAIKQVQAFKTQLEQKEQQLLEKLAFFGATRVSLGYSQAFYDGVKDINVEVDVKNNQAIIKASGESVAFIEFGSGIKYGYGHPQANEFNYGPSTWSLGEEGKGHWDNPNGWYYAHGMKSWGNPPSMTMYKTALEIQTEIARIVDEVFNNDR